MSAISPSRRPASRRCFSFDDARTLFHEFGHALHGLLSNVTYPLLSGTAVSSDFVELPSQLYEHWLEQPEILQQLRAPRPDRRADAGSLLDGCSRRATSTRASPRSNIFASAMVDLDLHCARRRRTRSTSARSSARRLTRIGMPAEIVMRHRLPHFQHLFSGGGYAAAYYSYMWSEVLDADAFEAFEETGDIFDPATAKRLRDFIYARRQSRDPAEAYKAFRGRLPTPEALLRKRGLAEIRRAKLTGMDLHTAGHRRGVVCAPHHAAVEAGRSILAEGGNAHRGDGGDGGDRSPPSIRT